MIQPLNKSIKLFQIYFALNAILVNNWHLKSSYSEIWYHGGDLVARRFELCLRGPWFYSSYLQIFFWSTFVSKTGFVSK